MPTASESFGSSAIRVDGAFNPAIISPDWLQAKGLIDEADREHAVEPDQGRSLVTSQFSGGSYPWIVVEVTRNALNVASTDETETPERLRDFVVRLLESLPETPVQELIVTHFWHLAVGPDAWRNLADALAPATPWESVAGESWLERLERGMQADGGTRTFAVEPSRRTNYDLYFEVVRYWDLAEEPPGISPTAAIEALERDWRETLRAAQRLLDTTLAIA